MGIHDREAAFGRARLYDGTYEHVFIWGSPVECSDSEGYWPSR